MKKNKLVKYVGILIFVIVIFVILYKSSILYANYISNKIIMINDISKKTGFYTLNNGFIKENDGNKTKMIDKTFSPGLSRGYIHINNSNKISFRIYLNGFCARKKYDENKIKVNLGNCWDKIEVFKKINSEQVFYVPKTGKYKIELWGARGGKTSSFQNAEQVYVNLINESYGKGAYVSGEILLNAGQPLYIYVGGKGGDAKLVYDNSRVTGFGYPSTGGKGGYNGGGSGFNDPEFSAGGGGGGATDIRLIPGTWDNLESLKSRIIVAGGAGGMSRLYLNNGKRFYKTGTSGSGGTLIGKNGQIELPSSDLYGYGSTQTSGYKLGIGENGNLCMSTINGLGGGAGGYYGSNSAKCNPYDWQPSTGAGGASSYVSGCEGCNAIDEKYSWENPKFTNQSIHYSGMYFKNIDMISGDDKMPNPYRGGTMIGNDNDGFARITYLGGGK